VNWLIRECSLLLYVSWALRFAAMICDILYSSMTSRIFSLLSRSWNCSYHPVNQHLRMNAMHRSSATVSRALDDQMKSLDRVLRFDDILLYLWRVDRRPKCSPFLRAHGCDLGQARLVVNTSFFSTMYLQRYKPRRKVNLSAHRVLIEILMNRSALFGS